MLVRGVSNVKRGQSRRVVNSPRCIRSIYQIGKDAAGGSWRPPPPIAGLLSGLDPCMNEGSGAIMAAIGATPPGVGSPPSGLISLTTGVLGGGNTSPRAMASACRASRSALEGRPRFLGALVGNEGMESGEPFEAGFG